MDNISYIAGFFDGEGTIGLYKQGRNYQGKYLKNKYCYVPNCVMSNTNKEVLEWIQQVIGGIFSLAHDRNTPSQRYKNEKPCWRLRFSNLQDVHDFCKLVCPYLKIKKKQCKLMIEWCSLRLSKKGLGYSKIIERNKGKIVKVKAIPYTKREMKIYTDLKRLNKRGLN